MRRHLHHPFAWYLAGFQDAVNGPSFLHCDPAPVYDLHLAHLTRRQLNTCCVQRAGSDAPAALNLCMGWYQQVQQSRCYKLVPASAI